MRVNLPLTDFSTFKTFVGSIYFALVLIYPVIVLYSFMIAFAVGRAHSTGAWFGMWRANKLTWKYVFLMSVLSLGVFYWGFRMVSLDFLIFFTTFLFAFHFFFDEYELQGSTIQWRTLLSGLNPLMVVWSYLLIIYYNLPISLHIVFVGSVILLLIECIHTDEMNWFFVQSKLHLVFIWLAAIMNIRIQDILGVLLTFHYFFWFIFPVYKLHKYKRSERDSFIMILILIIASSLFFAGTKDTYSQEIYDMARTTFMVLTIIHILGTAPFGYLFGLKRSLYVTK